MGNTEDRENVENVEEPDQRTEQAGTPEGMAVMYGDFLLQCFDIAISVMERAEILPDEGLLPELQTRIAHAGENVRDRSGISGGAHEGQRGREGERERVANLPPMPIFGAMVPVAECKHPGLAPYPDPYAKR